MRMSLYPLAVGLLLLLSATCWGQQVPLKADPWKPTKTENKALGFTEQNLVATADGGYIVADQLTGEQQTLQVGDYTYEGLFKWSAYLVKYSPEDKPLWSVAFSGASQVDGLVSLKDGSSIVVLSYAGTMTAKQKGTELFQVSSPTKESCGISVVILSADGALVMNKALPLTQNVESWNGPTRVLSVALDENAGSFYCTMALLSELQLGSTTLAPAPMTPDPDTPSWKVYETSLTVEVVLSLRDLGIQRVISYKSTGKADKPLATSNISALRHAGTPDGTTFTSFSLFGWVDEENLDATGASTPIASYKKGTENDLADARAIILRASSADGSKKWEKEIKVERHAFSNDNYCATAHIRQLVLSPDGSKLLAFGLFQGKLTFPDDNSTLESKKSEKDDTYATDAFILIIDPSTGNILNKQKLGFNSLGYAIYVNDLTLTMPFQVATQFPHIYLATAYQHKITLNGTTIDYNELETSDPKKLNKNKNRYGTALLHLYYDGSDIAPLEIFPLQTDSYFRVAGLVPGRPAHIRALGSLATKKDPASLNLAGTKRSDSYEVGKHYTFLTDIDFSIPTTLTFTGMPDNLALDLATNGGAPVTYINADRDKFPQFQLGDTYKMTLKEYNHAPFAKYLLRVNGIESSGDYRLTARPNKVEVEASSPSFYTVELAQNPLNEHFDIVFHAGDDRATAPELKPGEKVKLGNKLWVTVTPKDKDKYSVDSVMVGKKRFTLAQLDNEGYVITGEESHPLVVAPRLHALDFPVLLAASSKLEGAAVSVSSGAKPSEQLTQDKPATTFTVRQGDKVKIVCKAPSLDVLLLNVTVNGQKLEGDWVAGVEYDVPVGVYKLELEVQAIQNPPMPIVVTYAGDFTLGGVKVQINQEAPIELKGDPTKYPALKARKLDKLTVTALPSEKGEFKGLTICGGNVENGNTFEVPLAQSVNIPIKVSFARKNSTPVEAQPLLSVETIVSGEQIRILGSWSAPLQVHIYNLLGVPRYARTFAPGVQPVIGLQGFPSGIYLMVLSSAEGQRVIRFVR